MHGGAMAWTTGSSTPDLCSWEDCRLSNSRDYISLSMNTWLFYKQWERENLLEKHELHSHKTEVTKWRRRSCELCLLVYLVSVNMSLTQSQMARLCMRRGHYACILHQLKGFTPYPKK
ncbi:hypothetical protein Y1Q_0004066 [Alligator mississippiensis]|uniref:Uncharacterized protein n=1 Tax=Alligator mississippiensis TaxID=8496 RepID=A0A151PI28_ALLMI|nr:hypothetical protein Y1Q_0004066 [Alligator mississippiensis]